MTDTDRTLMVLAFALIVFTYYACVLVLEGLKELRSAIRRWRVRHELDKTDTRVVSVPGVGHGDLPRRAEWR